MRRVSRPQAVNGRDSYAIGIPEHEAMAGQDHQELRRSDPVPLHLLLESEQRPFRLIDVLGVEDPDLDGPVFPAAVKKDAVDLETGRVAVAANLGAEAQGVLR